MLEAKDTLIRDRHKWGIYIGNELLAQADISFFKGEEQGMRLGLQLGKKMVIEFISDLIIGIDGCKFEERLGGDKGCIVLDMNENQWQVQKEEWNIEKT